MELSKIITILVIVLIIAIILSIVKRVAKLIILILAAVLMFIVIRTVILGGNPLGVFNDTKTATTYTKQIYDYSGKISGSVNSTIKAMENNSFSQLKNENGKLHEYLQQVSKLQHIKELNKFHEQYIKYLSDIVSASDTAVNGTNLKNGTVKNIDEIKTRLNKYITDLTQLRFNQKF
ncbi:MAG: hypothetical protein K0R54_973 [Clostridiaceae bacterium]|nr:hypothetical protein [Clostridiaceae bacterium]